MEKNKCPECDSQNLVHDYDSGETICSNCGLVLREQMIDRGPERRAYTEEEKATRIRTGMPTTYAVHDKGLSTQVGRGGPLGVSYDAFGRKLPPATQAQMWRLRKWQIRSRAHTSVDRNLTQAMLELDRLADQLGIPKLVKERGAVIYRKTLKKGLTRGRGIKALVAAALYAACRYSGVIRTLEEIAEGNKEFKKDIARCYRLLLKELNIQMPTSDPVSCVSKIAETVGISGETQGLAIRILRQAKIKRIHLGKDPMGFAAAALYSTCLLNREEKTQREIAEIAKVTEVTVRNRYKELKRKLGLKLPDPPHQGKGKKLKERTIRSFLLFELDKFYVFAIIKKLMICSLTKLKLEERKEF